MEPGQPLSPIVKLTSPLLTSTKNSDANISRLVKALQESHINLSGVQFFKQEEESLFAAGQQNVFEKFSLQREAAGAELSADKRFHVFRREAPVLSSRVKGSVPDWAHGASPAYTLGPYFGNDGRKFWFDFYSIVKLVAIAHAGDAQPIALLRLSVPLVVARPVSSFTIDAGSVWLRADLLASGASKQQYAALKVTKGKFQLSKAYSVTASNHLNIDSSTTFDLDLELDNEHTSAATAQYGKDAHDADVQLPAHAKLHYATTIKATALGDGSWKLYGDGRSFTFSPNEVFHFDPFTSRVYLPVKTEADPFVVKNSESSFFSLDGTAAIATAGWSLPIAVLDLANPVAAAGNGAWMLLCKEGLQCTWQPFSKGDAAVQLQKPVLLAQPGKFSIGDLLPKMTVVETDFNLWLNKADDEKKIRSTCHLTLKSNHPLLYYSDEAGVEGIAATADTAFYIDRPVQVDESPVRLQTVASVYYQWMTVPLQYVMLYDADMLLDLNAFDKFKQLHTQTYAMANALLLTTPPAALLFAGELKNENTFDAAMLSILYGLFSLTPSLPHPYASSLASFQQMDIIQSLNNIKEAQQWTRFIRNTVLAFVQWTEDPAQEKTLSLNSDFRILGNLLPNGAVNVDNANDNNIAAGDFARARIPDRLALLDVSTQADLFGVGMLWNDRIYRSLNMGVVEQISEGVVNISNMHLETPLGFLTSFNVPGISWEPMINRFKPQDQTIEPTDPPELQSIDPDEGYQAFPNQGFPNVFYNSAFNKVAIDAAGVITEIITQFNTPATKTQTISTFNLPFGMTAVAYLQKKNQHTANPYATPVHLAFIQPSFEPVAKKVPPAPGDKPSNSLTKTHTGALQVKAAGAPDKNHYRSFSGFTLQLANLVNLGGVGEGASTLGASVHYIFNNEFFHEAMAAPQQRLPYGVPVERIDFSGYGNHIFSDWKDPDAKFAQTSEVKFEVLRGRTAQEVIQVVSIVYPWGIKVVRTITITRENSAIVYRDDSGWKAQSDGLYDFTVEADGSVVNPYVIHPGVVKGLYNVTNIYEIDGDSLSDTVTLNPGDLVYDAVNRKAHKFPHPSHPSNKLSYKFQAVTFDADVLIENAVLPVGAQYISGKRFKGYVQLAPEGVPVPDKVFSGLLQKQSGSLGGDVDCIVLMGAANASGKNQKLKISRVDVNASFQNDNTSDYSFIAAAKGSVLLPAEGSWSLVQHDKTSGNVSPADNTKGVPLVRKGEWQKAGNGYTVVGSDDLYRIEHVDSLLNAAVPGLKHYGFLQNTGTQKLLLRQPRVKGSDVKTLLHEIPDFADTFRLLNSTGPFPNINDVIPVTLPGAGATNIIEKGLQKALDNFNIPDKPFYIFNEKDFRLYVEYKRTEKSGGSQQGSLDLGFDSASRIWNADLNSVQLVVDLGIFDRLMTVSGVMNAANGIHAGFNPAGNKSQLILCDELQPIYDILVILASLNPLDPNYAEILKKGLEVAMSNSADNWEYKLHAEKEIPLIKFPPEPLYSSPQTLFKLEAGMKVGLYFNMPLTLPQSASQLIPSAGAYLQLDGRIEVMCFSLGAAAIFAVGTATVILGCDIKSGPSLYFKFGFGAEIVVGLPVIANVSVTFIIGVDMSLDSKNFTVGAFMLFKGTADILGGLVTIVIQIEAAGEVQKRLGDASDGQTNCIATVNFSLDISILWVIDISFSESWSETRQIA